jgi:LmbE family N-acetylglucosaminyl deacetylase
MIFDAIDRLDGDYAHVYLAPHLDDAPLSCGGAIAEQTARGERALVVTLCTAAPAPEGPFSALALEFHREWGLAPEQVVAARLREERAAVTQLGADGLWAGMLDAIYRHPDAYHGRETLFGTPAGDDPLLPAARTYLDRLRQRLPAATFYAPLGVGSHVDHLLTHEAAAILGPELIYYEDFPYVARPGALERRLAQLGAPLEPALVGIDRGLERKIAAVLAYASQLPELAHSQLDRPIADDEAPGLFAAAIADYARQTGGGSPAERLWHRAREQGQP